MPASSVAVFLRIKTNSLNELPTFRLVGELNMLRSVNPLPIGALRGMTKRYTIQLQALLPRHV
jgi:hypothetical protein